jgi:hypothetical protein
MREAQNIRAEYLKIEFTLEPQIVQGDVEVIV